MSQLSPVSWLRASSSSSSSILALTTASYIVDQRKQAVVLRFGEPQRVVNAFRDNEPGLKIKVPFLENVVLFDKRNPDRWRPTRKR